LNLGCGNDIRDVSRGWVNVDVTWHTGVDRVLDLEHQHPWPWSDGSIDEILALNLLEHVTHLDVVWGEMYRILRPHGLLRIEVEYGTSRDPFHHNRWNRGSIRSLLNGYATPRRQQGPSYELVEGPRFRNVGGFPWWHVRRYLHVEPPCLPFTRRLMRFTLEKLP
jgi:hypothetical protein